MNIYPLFIYERLLYCVGRFQSEFREHPYRLTITTPLLELLRSEILPMVVYANHLEPQHELVNGLRIYEVKVNPEPMDFMIVENNMHHFKYEVSPQLLAEVGYKK
jgi:hypothetical protein